MSTRWVRRLQTGTTWRPTLQLRLALLSGGLVFALTASTVLFINIAVAALITTDLTVALPAAAVPIATWVPGQPTPTPLATRNNISESAVRMTAVLVPETTLHRLQILSVMSLGAVLVLGSAGAYWLAGKALQPVRRISQAALRIGAGTLERRLSLDGADDELKELAEAFNAMLDRLERAFQQQSRFVADAAHELRTPLATLRTTLELVRDDPHATLGEYRDMIVIQERTLVRLERLVLDMLVLATDEDELRKDQVALGPLLEDVLLAIRPVADEHQVTLRLFGESEVSMCGNEMLLAHVFRNLIENGIYYNRPGGEVSVTLGRDSSWIVVKVADTGIGIAQREQARIFDRFYRADRASGRRVAGTGLGLSIVIHIVRQHGGDVQVKSVLGAGSTFTVLLPQQATP